jgi:hypothetical protein
MVVGWGGDGCMSTRQIFGPSDHAYKGKSPAATTNVISTSLGYPVPNAGHTLDR